MPRFTLFQSAAKADDPALEPVRQDHRVHILAEQPGLLLVETTEATAKEWSAKLQQWKLQPERRAKIPDPRPKVRVRVH